MSEVSIERQRIGRRLLCGFVGTAASIMASAAHATPVVEDRFDDGSVSKAPGSYEADWYPYGTSATVGQYSPSGNTSDAMICDGSSDYFELYGDFPSTTLSDGDNLLLTLDFRRNNGSNGDLRFALGTGQATFGFWFATGATESAWAGIYQAVGDSMSNGTNITTLGSQFAINDTDSHALSLSISKSGSALSISGNIDSIHPFSGLATGVSSFDFSKVAVGNGARGGIGFNIDNIAVAVPEPASLSLLGFAVGLLRRRRAMR